MIERIKRRLKEGQMSESLLMGIFLTAAGGFLDAYTYLARGHVFANAQTGNIVLLGIAASQGDWLRAALYLVPIASFCLGVLAAEVVRGRCGQGWRRLHWRQVVILAEAAILVAVGFLPISMNQLANCLVSFVCALQVEAFRKIRGNAVATTMCTGNLRGAAEALYGLLLRRDPDERAKLFVYLGTIGVFLAGTACGTFATDQMNLHAVWLAAVLLGAGFFAMFVQEEKGQADQAPY